MIQVRMGDKIVPVDPKKLKKRFDGVVLKYNLSGEQISNQITGNLFDLNGSDHWLPDFLINSGGRASAEAVAQQFSMEIADANVFLSWISIGLQFKEQVIDPNGKNAQSSNE